nr:YkvA family protein [Spirochaetaceae bacterium]
RNLKSIPQYLKSEINQLNYANKNPKTGRLPKIIIFITLGYALSPVDLIPDFIPVLGYLDDLIILPVLISLSIRLIPKEIIEESRVKANQEPLNLKKRWAFGVLIIMIWVFILGVIIKGCKGYK